MLSPIKLTILQEELCKRLDLFNQKAIQGQELSDLFRGAIYATRNECRNNPDWMAQSAHSLREILYPFYTRKNRVINAFRSYGSVTTTEEKTFITSVGEVYGKITDVAHHKSVSIEDYEKIIEDFQSVLRWALYRQVDIHNQIDEFFSETRSDESSK